MLPDDTIVVFWVITAPADNELLSTAQLSYYAPIPKVHVILNNTPMYDNIMTNQTLLPIMVGCFVGTMNYGSILNIDFISNRNGLTSPLSLHWTKHYKRKTYITNYCSGIFCHIAI
jgi:hypothetical protein